MKKGLQKFIKFSNLFLLIVFSIACIITTIFATKPKDYSHLTEYTSALVLNDEVQICNRNELYIKHVGADYYYANILNDQNDTPIFTYRGQRLNFRFDSEVIEYTENAPAKCRIISRDSRITGTFEFELRPRKLAERDRNTGLYIGYLICGIVVSAILARWKALKSKSGEQTPTQDVEKDLLYAIGNYDFNKAENAEVKIYVTNKLKALGYDSVEQFTGQKADEKRKDRSRAVKLTVAEYLISSGWLCGGTALIVSILVTDFISGFPVAWLISVPVIAAGYILKRKSAVGNSRRENK